MIVVTLALIISCVMTRLTYVLEQESGGYRVVYVPRAKVWQMVSATARNVSNLKEFARNRFLLQKKFLSGLEFMVFLFSSSSGFHIIRT